MKQDFTTRGNFGHLAASKERIDNLAHAIIDCIIFHRNHIHFCSFTDGFMCIFTDPHTAEQRFFILKAPLHITCTIRNPQAQLTQWKDELSFIIKRDSFHFSALKTLVASTQSCCTTIPDTKNNTYPKKGRRPNRYESVLKSFMIIQNDLYARKS